MRISRPRRATAIGVDLAWSARHETGLAAARVTEGYVKIVATGLKRSTEEILAFVREHRDGPLTIAVDAPTVVPNAGGMRECERVLHERFGSRRVAPYPGNRALLGRVNGGRPRGEELVDALQAIEIGVPPARHDGIYAMEVFPAPALLILFRLERGLRYKKRRGMDWASCRAGLDEYLRRLQTLRGPALRWKQPPRIGQEKGIDYKRIEDQMDAVLCAYLAGMAWLRGEEALEMVGTVQQGYIVLPRTAHTQGKAPRGLGKP